MSSPSKTATAERAAEQAHADMLRLAAERIADVAHIFKHAGIAAVEAWMRDVAENKAAKKGMRDGARDWLITRRSLREREKAALEAAEQDATIRRLQAELAELRGQIAYREG